MSKIAVNADYCKGCLICVAYCPKKVLRPSKSINSKGYTLPEAVEVEKCTECGMCETVCPDFAIAVKKSTSSHA